MLWSKQFYHYIVEQWLDGDPAFPPPPQERKQGRNSGWRHLYNERVMSMPDKWEFPWYASWDLAFHCIPLALVDPEFAKSQLDLIVREWYQHPFVCGDLTVWMLVPLAHDEPARSHRARVVPASKRSGPRIRMEFR